MEQNHDQLNDLAAEARARHQEYSKQVATLRKEQRGQLSERDEKYVKLQNDYKGLHEILAKVQAEHSKQIKMFQDERNSYEQRIMEGLNKAKFVDQSAKETIATYQQDYSQMKQQIDALQRELQVRTEQHLQVLEKVQYIYRQTGDRIHEENSNLKAMKEDVDSLKQAVKYQMTHMLKPHQAHHENMQQNVMSMQDMMQKMKEDYQLARDAKIHAEALAEEQRSENIMLNEEVSKLEMQNHNIALKLENMEIGSSSKVKALKVDFEAALESRTELEQQLRRTMDQLQEANNTSRQLQIDNRDLHTHDNFQQEMAEKAQMASKQLHESRLNEQELTQNNELLKVECDQLRNELQQQNEKMQYLQHEIIEAGENYRSQISTEKVNQGKYKAQVESLGGVSESYNHSLGKRNSC